MPILKTMDKASISITEEEAKAVLKAIDENKKYVILCGNYIVLSGVSGIYKDEVFDDKSIGRLHDGTKVIKQFGRWVDALNPNVQLDTSYYPEIANDTVMTEREYVNKQSTKTLLQNRQVKMLGEGEGTIGGFRH